MHDSKKSGRYTLQRQRFSMHQQYACLPTIFVSTTLKLLINILAKILFNTKKKHPSTPQLPQAVVCYNSNGDYYPFFGIHPGNGQAVFYHRVSKILGENYPVYGFQIVHKNDITTIKKIAKRYS